MTELTVDTHPTLRTSAFVTTFKQPLGETNSPDWLISALRVDADAPLQRSEELRAAVRDMLRHGGYKPTGRGKPASEYLLRAAEEGALRSINLAVDACNVVSLHSGLPITVIDIARAAPPFRVALAPPGSSYVFNPAGQEIDVAGLVCLYDAEGPCGNAVKDAQRTKTHERTRETLSVIWGCAGHEAQMDGAIDWYRALLQRAGATTLSL